MRFASPAALWLALLALPVLALHILRPKRPGHVVSSTFLWRRIEQPVTSATPFRRFRPSWLLLVQLLAVALVTIAAANPVRVEPTALAPHTVVLIDGSGSMLALDGTPDRIADARERAVDLRNDLPAEGVASVIEVGPQPRVLLSASADREAFEEAVASVRATSGSADFAGAFALAEGLETADAPIGFVLISDGGLTEEEQRLLPPGTAYEQVGDAATNRAIVDLDVEPGDDALHVRVTIANRSSASATQTLRLDVDGRTRDRVELEIGGGRSIVHEADLALGDRVDAILEGEDLLAADNTRTAVARRRAAIRVQIVGQNDPFLAALLGSIDGVELIPADDAGDTSGEGSGDTDEAATEDDADGDAATQGAPDLIVYDRVAVPTSPTVPFLAIRPPGGVPGVDVVGEVETPVLTLVVADDPLLAGVDLSDLAVATAQRVRSDTSEVLLGAEGAPLLLRGRVDGVRFAYLPFALGDSNLPVQLAFPLLGDRLTAELTGATLPPSALEVGDTLTVPPRTGGVIIDPLGVITELAPGAVGVTAERPGVWTVAVPDRPEVAVAVNPAARESDLTPVPALPTERRQLRAGEEPPAEESSLRPWVIGVLLAVLALEWLLARRRVGVRPGQWRMATALRAIVALALLGALFDVGFDRDAGEVATVFVVDASDSLGSAGREAGLDFVRAALDDQPDGARSAVVLFGGDARIEALMQRQLALAQPSVQIDASQTDIAAALRLGGAILPGDARRRIVLVSDGRVTRGDAAREAALLRERGVAVDVHLVDTPAGADLAVASVRTPDRVAEGETVPIEVELDSTIGGPAVVTLRRNGEVVANREVDVVVGRQTVSFTDVAEGDGPLRYQVDIESRVDGIAQNNTAFAAVQVEGPPRVLVIEGVPDEGVELAGALTAGGLDVDITPAEQMPGLDELVGYSSIVLVDVDQRQLTERQVAALGGAVRDAGRGLVTIGGVRSYGLGGYYTSELERLLPVISEILDPQRRQTVAEVLAIDSSGSMGACHCAEGQFASNRFDGGVVKTDISRAAAARTIAALSENDEVGVLAFDVEDRWVIDLQQLPAQDVVNQGLATINPGGGTDPSTSLATAAEALRESNAALKHVILFTDGFTSPAILDDLATEAASLLDEGITVSVVATGEGAARELEAVATAGGGRFYPGRDLQMIPEIIMEEAVLASRDFVNEGEFFPLVTSSRPVVADLTESPPLLGYVATNIKPGATSLLRIGPDEDPLLASWQVGLGTATSWTSDASSRWSQRWATWDGYVRFWSRVVRDTFPAISEGATAFVDDGVLRVRVENDGSFGDDATAIARITDPTLASREVVLDRVGADTFVGEVAVDDAGVYVVGTSVSLGDGTTVQGSTLTSQSYAREYEPGAPDSALLARVAEAGGGRTDIEPAMAFDRADLAAGSSRIDLARWLLPAAALLFVVAVIAGRLTLAPVAAAVRTRRLGVPERLRRRRADPTGADSSSAAPSTATSPTAAPSPRSAPAAGVTRPRSVADQDAAILDEVARRDDAAATETLSALLERTRERRSGPPPPKR